MGRSADREAASGVTISVTRRLPRRLEAAATDVWPGLGRLRAHGLTGASATGWFTRRTRACAAEVAVLRRGVVTQRSQVSGITPQLGQRHARQGRDGDGRAAAGRHLQLDLPVLRDHERQRLQRRAVPVADVPAAVHVRRQHQHRRGRSTTRCRPANPPVYTNGGKTVVVNMKGWKWSNGETVDATVPDLLPEHGGGARRRTGTPTPPGLLPDNVDVLQGHRAQPGDHAAEQGVLQPSGTPTTSSPSSTRCRWPGTSPAWAPSRAAAAASPTARPTGWAKCKAVYTFLTAQSKIAATYATSPLWSVVDGPWKLSSFSTDGNVTIVPNKDYSGSPKPKLSAVKFVPFTARLGRVHGAEDRAGRRGLHPDAGPAAEAGELGRCRRPTRWAARYNLQPFYSLRHPATPSRTSTTRRWASWSGSSTSARPCSTSMDQPGIDKAI